MIADSWSPEELLQAEALARLEGWGQEKRRTAAILAELHNVFRIDAWRQSPKGTQWPKLATEEEFLPKRVSRKKIRKQREQAVQRLSSIMNSLCGFG